MNYSLPPFNDSIVAFAGGIANVDIITPMEVEICFWGDLDSLDETFDFTISGTTFSSGGFGTLPVQSIPACQTVTIPQVDVINDLMTDGDVDIMYGNFGAGWTPDASSLNDDFNAQVRNVTFDYRLTAEVTSTADSACADGMDIQFTGNPYIPAGSQFSLSPSSVGFVDNMDGTATLDVSEAAEGQYIASYIVERDDCFVQVFDTVKVNRTPSALLRDVLLNCRTAGSQVNLGIMTAEGSDLGGTFTSPDIAVDSNGNITLPNVPSCYTIIYEVENQANCIGGTYSDTAFLSFTLSPTPSFDIDSTQNFICTSGDDIPITLTRTSSGPNPNLYRVVDGDTVPMTFGTFILPGLAAQGAVSYSFCFEETLDMAAPCGNQPTDSTFNECSVTTCKELVLYNDGNSCGSMAPFQSECNPTDTVFSPCFINTYPELEVACAIFSLPLFQVVDAELNANTPVGDCSMDSISIGYNSGEIGRFFDAIDLTFAQAIVGLTDLIGLGAIGSVINFICDVVDAVSFCIDVGFIDICISPLDFLPGIGPIFTVIKAICTINIGGLLQAGLAFVFESDGGGGIIVADTDGDGAFDYIVDDYDMFGQQSNEPDIKIPINVEGSGVINVRHIVGYPNKPVAACGESVIDGTTFLDVVPIGAIPSIGPQIEEFLETVMCDFDIAWTDAEDLRIPILNSSKPTFISCPEEGYVFTQDLGCDVTGNWAPPVAVDGCNEQELPYRGAALFTDTTFYNGASAPEIISVTESGVYQVSGPVSGSDLPVGDYTVSYIAYSCNGIQDTCSFNISVTSGDPVLSSLSELIYNNDIDACYATVGGLTPQQGVGCNSIINYNIDYPPTSGFGNISINTPFTANNAGTHNDPSGRRFPVGTSVIRYTMLTDINGDGDVDDAMERQLDTTVIIVTDNQKPSAICQDIQVQLDSTGSATIYATDQMDGSLFIDGGCTDNCGNPLVIDISKDRVNYDSVLIFDCSEIGGNIIYLRATDTSGNVSTCIASVQVLDFFEDVQIAIDLPEICLESTNPSQLDFSNFVDITLPNGEVITPNEVMNNAFLGDVEGVFGISSFLPHSGSSSLDPGTITPEGVYTPGTGSGFVSISYILYLPGASISLDSSSDFAGCIIYETSTFELWQPLQLADPECLCGDQTSRTVSLGTIRGGLEPYTIQFQGANLDVDRDGSSDIFNGEYVYDAVNHDISDLEEDLGNLNVEFTQPVWSFTVLDARGCELFRSGSCDSDDLTEGPQVNCPPSETGIGTERFLCQNQYSWRHPLPTDNCTPVLYSYQITHPDGSIAGPFDLTALLNSSVDPNANVFETSFDFELGISIVSYYVEDAVGLADSCAFEVTIIDDDMPYFINCIDSIVIDAMQDSCGAFVNWALPIALDNCTDTLQVTQIEGLPTGSYYPVGRTPITFLAVDADGNRETCSFDVVVYDRERPKALCKDIDIFVNENCDVTILPMDVDAGSTDNCGIQSLTISTDGITYYDSLTFGFDDLDPAQTTVWLRVIDIYGNESYCTADLEVFDITDPFVICRSDTVIFTEPDECYGLVPNVIPPIDVDDNCIEIAEIQQYPDPGVIFGSQPNDSLLITVVVIDTDGNEDSCSLYAVLADTTVPYFINCPRPTINVNSYPDECAALVNFSLPIAEDNCGDLTLRRLDSTGLNSGDDFPVGLTVLSWIAEDQSGNQSDTCRVKIIVNDTEPPLVTCPDDVTVGNDLGICEATVNNLKPLLNDQCPLNVLTVYQISSLESGLTIGAGFDDASGELFGCGASELTYRVQDHPLVLITEVTHDLEAPVGGTNSVPGYISTNTLSGDDFVEVTNFGPNTVSMNCLSLLRKTSTNVDTIMVPWDLELESGEVATFHFGPGTDDEMNNYFATDSAADLAQGDPAGYELHFEGNIVDAVAVNGASTAGFSGTIPNLDGRAGVIRSFVFDTDQNEDWRIADGCDAMSIGSYNQDYPPAVDRGALPIVGLQSMVNSGSQCSMLITVEDAELPECATFEQNNYSSSGDSVLVACNEYEISVADNFQIGRVVFSSYSLDHSDTASLSFFLLSPDQTLMPLSKTTPDTLVAFNGELSQGIWTLLIADNDLANDGFLTDWSIDIYEHQTYAQGDTTIQNDPGICFAEFVYQAPEIIDNCDFGILMVSYTSQDDIQLPTDRIVSPAEILTNDFQVGITTVTFTIIDKNNNRSTCSFDVEVLDVERPTLICPDDITIQLDPGDCSAFVHFAAEELSDNCSIDTFYSIPPSGSEFSIGTTQVVMIAIDPSGNVDSCTFDIIVNEFVPATGDLVCNGLIHLSLDADCEACINADQLLEGNQYRCYDNYCVTIEDGDGDVLPDNCIGLAQVGDTLRVSIYDCLGNNENCWGYVYVEDKIRPEIICPPDLTVTCNSTGDTSITGSATLNTCESNASIRFEDEMVRFSHCDSIRARLTRTWIVTDDSDNEGRCTQVIAFNGFDRAELTFPQDITYEQGISCEAYMNDSSIVLPEYTGEPMIDGKSIYDRHSLCEVNVGYWDEELVDVNCTNGFMILRNWVVFDECKEVQQDANPIRHIQVIRVVDFDAPVVNCVAEYQIETTTNTCYAHFDFKEFAPEVLFDCGGIKSIEVIEGLQASALPIGTHELTYRVTDNCHNFTDCRVIVHVIDNVPPVPVCDAVTTINLGSDGYAFAKPETFDDGSFDNCEVADLFVRRLEASSCYEGHPIPSNTAEAALMAADSVWFCCEDLTSGFVQVELIVIDVAGNSSSCIVDVEVRNAIAPMISAPSDITVSCDFKYELSDEGLNLAFGKVVRPQFDEEREDIVINDSIYQVDCIGQQYVGPIEVGKDGYVQGVCGVEVQVTNQLSLNCGAGTIVRRFVAVSPNGLVSSPVEQMITIVDCNPFFITDTDTRCDDDGDGIPNGWTSRDDIDWPCDYEELDCMNGDISPDGPAGRPTIREGADDKCAVIADTFYDEVFTVVEDACLKIERHWSVIDWCQMTADGTPRRWDYTQVIKVSDQTPPTLTPEAPLCDDQAEGCGSAIELTVGADDECTPADMLDYWWRIDAFNDGQGPLSGDYDFAGRTRVANLQDVPAGTHRIIWVVDDLCGNRSTLEDVFTVQDCKKPSPVCIDGLSSVVMPSSGEITIWASDFNASSFDNCTKEEDLEYRIWYPQMDSANYIAPKQDGGDWTRPSAAFSGDDVLDSLPTGAAFYCDMLPTIPGTPIEVEIYVIDEAGNWDFCTTRIVIDDNDNVCGSTGPSVSISGQYTNEIDEVLPGVAVTLLRDQDSGELTQEVDANGRYRFRQPAGGSYSVSGVRLDDIRNGLTANDLTLIQRHILGMEELTSNYKLVAADANLDRSIDIRDVALLRQALLSMPTELEEDRSWVTIDGSYTFPGITATQLPADVYEQDMITFVNMVNDVVDADFVGVKVGDVDGDVILGRYIEPRTAGGLIFEVTDVEFEAGEIVEVAVRSTNFTQMTGYQMTLGFENSVLTYVGAEGNGLSVGEDNFGTHHTDRGLITSVWYAAQPESFNNDETLFTLKFRAEEAGSLAGLLSVGSTLTSAQSFNTTGRGGLNLQFVSRSGAQVEKAFALYQNAPNPFGDVTSINYDLPDPAAITFSVFDANGRLILTSQENGTAGLNTITVNKTNLPTTGLLYYQVSTDEHSATKKMIVVE